ncbi:hypothetical protein KK424_07325 [Clostridioides difficile]|nr:hypothetical protein [Clostridioides difficile]
MLITYDNSIKKNTRYNINKFKNGEVTLIELDEIYKKMGFLFVVSEGKLKKIKRRIIIRNE